MSILTSSLNLDKYHFSFWFSRTTILGPRPHHTNYNTNLKTKTSSSITLLFLLSSPLSHTDITYIGIRKDANESMLILYHGAKEKLVYIGNIILISEYIGNFGHNLPNNLKTHNNNNPRNEKKKRKEKGKMTANGVF